MLTPQHPLDLAAELVVDLFAGGGGASTGIEAALGYPPHIAINHDPEAVALRQLRQQRRNAPGDPLAQRLRIIKLWSTCPWLARLGMEADCKPFYRNRTFRRLLLPKLAARLAQRDRARREAQSQAWHAESAAWEAKKEAARQQRLLARKLAASPVADLFGAAA